MANEQDLMAMMSGGPAAGGALPPGAPPTDTTPPIPTPMSTPEPKNGQREAALINVSMALDLLEQALPAVGSESPEGKRLMSALSALTSLLGPKKQKTGELQNAEILQLLQNLPQAGGGGMPKPGMMNAPGGPPAGAPPMPPPGGMPPGGAPPMPM